MLQICILACLLMGPRAKWANRFLPNNHESRSLRRPRRRLDLMGHSPSSHGPRGCAEGWVHHADPRRSVRNRAIPLYLRVVD
jgi:hypothetical protein